MPSNLVLGERLQAAAYTTTAIQPLDLGLVINGSVYFFSAIATVIISLRVWARFFTEQRWGWDDLLAVTGYLAFIPSNVIGVLSTYYGLGASDSSLEAFDTTKQELLRIRAVEYFMYYEILYFAASATTKVSITLAVLRLCVERPIHRAIAIGNAVMMIMAAGAAGVFVLTHCRPFATYWNPDLCCGECTFGTVGLGSLEVVSLIGSTFQMLSDWISALLPFFIISKLQMPWHTKIALVCILGLGILASIAAFARMLFYKYWDRTLYPENYLFHTGIIVITSELEVGLGIVACSLPPLRRLVKSAFMTYFSSVGKSDHRDEDSRGTHLSPLPRRGLAAHNQRAQDKTGKWERLFDKKSSEDNIKSQRNHIIRSTTVSIETRDGELTAFERGNAEFDAL